MFNRENPSCETSTHKTHIPIERPSHPSYIPKRKWLPKSRKPRRENASIADSSANRPTTATQGYRGVGAD
jgi:hypothetical protein